MKSLCPPGLETSIRCRVAASSALDASAETIAQWRKQPQIVGAEKLSPSLFKHADDHTVIAFIAVRTAVEQAGWRERSFVDWGVIAAANFFARASMAQTIVRYRQEGAWGVSPHVIPQQSLHAVSGTISQAFKIHGPNFGVNGGPNASVDALLIAGAMLMDGQLPGLWVVLTGHLTECIPALEPQATATPLCQAVALALTPLEPRASGMHLAIGHVRAGADAGLAHCSEFQLALFAEELSQAPGLRTNRWRLAPDHWLELDMTLDAAEGRP